MNYNNLRFIVRITTIAVFVGIFFVLLAYDRVWSGTLQATYTFNKISPYIQKLVPDARVQKATQDAQGFWYQRMVIDPVYFEVRVPQSFKQVELVFTYKNQGQPWMEVGVQYDKDQYALYPLENSVLSSLDWFSLTKEDMTLFQKKKGYDSVEAFLSQVPKNKKILTYHTKPFGEEMNIETNVKAADYILAQVPKVTIKEGLTTARVMIPLEGVSRSVKGAYRFMISAPQLDMKKAFIDWYSIQTIFTDPVYE